MNKLRQKILATNDIKRDRVHVDAWDCEVEVRGLSGEQRARLIKLVRDEDGKTDETAFAVAAVIESAYDPETGERVFNVADRDELMAKSIGALGKVATRILQLSGLVQDDDEREAIRKNSATASDDSTSDSPKPSDAPSANSSSASVATS